MRRSSKLLVSPKANDNSQPMQMQPEIIEARDRIEQIGGRIGRLAHRAARIPRKTVETRRCRESLTENDQLSRVKHEERTNVASRQRSAGATWWIEGESLRRCRY